MSNCITLSPALSSLSIALQSDCNVVTNSALFKPIYTKEKVFIKPELDTIENEPISASGNSKDTVFIDTFLRSTTDINVPLEIHSTVIDLQNSYLYPLLKISYLREEVLFDTDKVKNFEYGDGKTIEITFNDVQSDIDSLTPNDGDLVFNFDATYLTLQIGEGGHFRQITKYDSLNLLELEQLCRHYVNANVGVVTQDPISKAWVQTGIQKFNNKGDILTIFYSSTTPTPSSIGDIWVDTSTDERVSKVCDNVVTPSFTDSTYVVGVKFLPSTEPIEVATILAKEAETKYTLKRVTSKLGFTIEPNSYIALKLSLYAEMSEEGGTFSLDSPPEINEFAIMGSDGDIKLTDKDNITSNANYFDCDMVEFDMATTSEHVPMFSPNSGFISFKYKPTLKLGGYRGTAFKSSVSELVNGEVKGFKTSVRNAKNYVGWRFWANRIKNADKQEKSDKKGAKYITKTMQCKDNVKDDSFNFEFHESV